MFTISVTSKNGSQESVNCEIDACSIGKGDDNLIPLQGWEVSRSHADLQKRTTGIYIVPIEGKWPTKVNGIALEGEYGPLSNSDMVQIGDYLIQVISAVTGEQSHEQEHKEFVSSSQDSTAHPIKSSPDTTKASASEEKVALGNKIREKIHQALILQMDLRRLDVHTMEEEELREKTKKIVDEYQQFYSTIDKISINGFILTSEYFIPTFLETIEAIQLNKQFNKLNID
jgi:pilus assembly protein CpaF